MAQLLTAPQKWGELGLSREGWAGPQTNESISILHTASRTQVIGEASVWGSRRGKSI